MGTGRKVSAPGTGGCWGQCLGALRNRCLRRGWQMDRGAGLAGEQVWQFGAWGVVWGLEV